MIAKTKFLLLQKILKYFMHAKFNILNDQHTHSNLAIKIKILSMIHKYLWSVVKGLLN